MKPVSVKSLSLFNLDTIISANAKKLIDFIFQYQIESKQDIYSLFCYYNFCDILNIYKENGGIIVFYLSTKCHNWLLEDSGIIRDINFSRFIKLITKRIRFPIIISNLSFAGFEQMLSEDSPEYDELINDYEFLSSLYEDIVSVIKNLKFYSLENELLKDVKAQIKLLSAFKN